MMKPFLHSKNSVKKFGGQESDYDDIHDFIDSTKSHVPDIRHRTLLHNSWGIFICERIFGRVFKNSDGKTVSVRDVAEEHIIEDLGFIPTVEKYLNCMTKEKWMSGTKKKSIKFNIYEGVENVD